MNAVKSILLAVADNLVNEQVPSLQLSIVQHGRIFELLGLAVGSIGDVTATILVEVVQQQVLVLAVEAGAGNTCQGVYDDLDTMLLCLLHDSTQARLSTEHLVGRGPVDGSKW